MTDHSSHRQTYWRRILGQTFVRWGARLGLGWVALLAMIGIFAPFLASSFPLLLSQNGVWSSPVLTYLQAEDVLFLIAFFSLLLVLPWRISGARKLGLFVLMVSIGGGLAYSYVDPPKLVIYEQYRVAEREGVYDWVIFAPVPYSPKDYQRDLGDTGLEAPLSQAERPHFFGTEQNGADVLSRMIHASRIALGIGFVATGIAMVIGVIIGGLMGYFSGIVDILGMRLVEIFEAVPTLFLLLTFVAFFGRSLYIMMVIIGITSWPGFARYVRAEFLRLRKQDFVQAAEAAGLPLPSILFRHMLPNGMGPVLVAASFGVASAILAEATLSFLGLGLVDDPSWGEMLNQAVQSSRFNWWMAAFPGGAIFFTVFAYNLIGESLRDAIDPYLSKSN
ncbi:MAG: ABC transporter permease [Candidatus Thiodiazotropha weberae]|uniref:ABC transporter permease n=1 Tax=Candidatus Thiodiazotropha endoloripes TaxID=1818881 RepID=A0A1E2UQY8_9GAMM|nr:ABC transporter permease [Candidatus Thiodiazotropha endoloripes]MCG7897587.1 ABC transporter permease [Candidatus Thiodiazotropha weberae]MCG7900831.1 ABC transporter permease [Candidatus Thiodiazotropha weberae]MCG7914825.1 ABC transporter permease [Candidatus Thiodiazotropha weberae]ODB85403.1 ABC transporter permease [Candidatus Thiodiazotropha endoloripes]ODB87824.1 ABC transporter permease [Candidatus Thiodiazotropha endoloripes]